MLILLLSFAAVASLLVSDVVAFGTAPYYLKLLLLLLLLLVAKCCH